jgi:23S rRNA (pseudouridine1915-N3)-methyltransferase
MQITLAHIGSRAPASDPFDSLTRTYLQRASAFIKSDSAVFRSEDAFFEWLTRQQGRTPIFPVLFDGRGRSMSSEEFAAWLGARRNEGVQHIAFAIGPADGWSDTARRRASLLLTLGPFTLAHALARIVLAEQLYRACTILAGHPYHTGH